jgi:hypothetical protein
LQQLQQDLAGKLTHKSAGNNNATSTERRRSSDIYITTHEIYNNTGQNVSSKNLTSKHLTTSTGTPAPTTQEGSPNLTIPATKSDEKQHPGSQILTTQLTTQILTTHNSTSSSSPSNVQKRKKSGLVVKIPGTCAVGQQHVGDSEYLTVGQNLTGSPDSNNRSPDLNNRSPDMARSAGGSLLGRSESEFHMSGGGCQIPVKVRGMYVCVCARLSMYVLCICA